MELALRGGKGHETSVASDRPELMRDIWDLPSATALSCNSKPVACSAYIHLQGKQDDSDDDDDVDDDSPAHLSPSCCYKTTDDVGQP